MQVSNLNDVKIYNLSVGKSLPEWLTDRKKRALQKKDIDIRRRIELIQDFDMPSVSNCIQVTPDQNYILATGVYKPRVRCYDVDQLSMKFERCFDAQIVKTCVLTQDYSKMVFLQDDRYVEFHHKYGKYYRTRIPRNGRDLAYLRDSCELYLVGASPEIYRLNLELGKFMKSIKTTAQEIHCCQFNDSHQLFTYGTKEGRLECIDPRTRALAGSVDCAAALSSEDVELSGVPGVTSLKYRDDLRVAAGTSTGQVLIFDVRSTKPLLIKDHNYELPIKAIEFNEQENLVMSMDSKTVKIWDYDTGKPHSCIEPENTKLNDFAVFRDTGLILIANEAIKMLAYYVPSVGAAPKWCSFLDNLTEELEETSTPAVYDDYKFVTRGELDRLGLTHLVGSNLLRAYMHGYFMDIRLYRKAHSAVEPFAYEDYRKQRIQEKIEADRTNRVQKKQVQSKVNTELADELLMESKANPKKKSADILADDRFAGVFNDPNFQVDTSSEAYRLVTPVMSKMAKSAPRKMDTLKEQFEPVEMEEREGQRSSDESEGSSSEDDGQWERELKEQHKAINAERKQQRKDAAAQAVAAKAAPKLFEIKEGSGLKMAGDKKTLKQQKKVSLGERARLNEERGLYEGHGSLGSKEMSFVTKKEQKLRDRKEESKAHHLERKKIRRSAHEITKLAKKPRWKPGGL